MSGDLISRNALIEVFNAIMSDKSNGLIDRLFIAGAICTIKTAPAVDAGPKWISVNDERKPKHGQEVVCRYVFDGDSEAFYAVLMFLAYGDNGYVTGPHFQHEGYCDMRVTHWFELPGEPVQDEKREDKRNDG